MGFYDAFKLNAFLHVTIVIHCWAQHYYYSTTVLKQPSCELIKDVHKNELKMLIEFVPCFFSIRNCMVLIDWKTSEKPKPVVNMTYDAPLQVAAYIGAMNADPNYDVEVLKIHDVHLTAWADVPPAVTR